MMPSALGTHASNTAPRFAHHVWPAGPVNLASLGEDSTAQWDTQRMKGLYVLNSSDFGLIYGPAERRDIAELVDIIAAPQTRNVARENPGVLADAEVIFSGWGGPVLDEAFLDAAPKLKAFFYAAGGLDVPPAVGERGIVVTRAIHANSVPVAEYPLATMLFSLQHGW